MKKPLTRLMIVLLVACAAFPLACAAFPLKRLGREPEKFKGNVKAVRTRTRLLAKKNAEWVVQSEPHESIQEISDPSESTDKDNDGRDEDTGSFKWAESDPIKAKQAEGYNAGYAVSHGGYGFYKADQEDNILEAAHYSSKGELMQRDFYTYDPNGREIEKASFTADGSFVSRRISSYDGQGNRIDETDYLSNGSVRRTRKWTFDSNNNVTQESLLDEGALKYKLTYSYKYDRIGNWVRRVKISEGFDSVHPTRDTKEIVERVITYR